MEEHDETWNVHRAILRGRGITLAGPAPETLIDPISPTDLREAMGVLARGGWTQVLEHPAQIGNRGYQSYTVLSLCRLLYTRHHGTITSKRLATEWVQQTQGERWNSLIERAWVGRHHPEQEACARDVNETLDFLRCVVGLHS